MGSNPVNWNDPFGLNGNRSGTANPRGAGNYIGNAAVLAAATAGAAKTVQEPLVCLFSLAFTALDAAINASIIQGELVRTGDCTIGAIAATDNIIQFPPIAANDNDPIAPPAPAPPPPPEKCNRQNKFGTRTPDGKARICTFNCKNGPRQNVYPWRDDGMCPFYEVFIL